MGKPDKALRAVHDPAAELVLEGSVEIETVLVEAHRFRNPIVGADDGGVASRVARADISAFHHRHVGDAVTGGQIIGGGETMAAAPDDHHVVRALRLVPLQREQPFDEFVHLSRSASSCA